MNFFIGKEGKQLGPFTEDQLRSMFESGMLVAQDLAWHEGLTDWYPLWQLLGTPPPLASDPFNPSTIAAGDEPWGRIASGWAGLVLSLLPGRIGNLGLLQMGISLLVLFSGKSARARWQGRAILWTTGGLGFLAFLIGLVSSAVEP